MKLGSLFDGIGGFPLAGSRHGVTPVWASEIETGPMAISTKHFPEMIHLGDVTKIDGAAVEPVDVITFGSPCQDLSVAGKRAGLEGARSGLFMEAIRIIKEMRCATNGPRFAVWENVPGAFSSNAGEDFRVILEELCRVKDETFAVPSSKWEPAGPVEGDGWSVAWRVLDAQFWGVPQRRKRIFVVADFAGGSAGQILFERESLRRDFAEGESAGQGTAADAAGGTGAAGFKWGNSKDARSIGYEEELSPTLAGSSGGNMVPAVITAVGFGGNVARALTARNDGSPCADRGPDVIAIYDMTHADEVMRPVKGDKVNTLNSRMGTGGNQVQVICQPTCRGGSKGLLIPPDGLAGCLTPWDAQGNRVVGADGVAPALRGGEAGRGYPALNITVADPLTASFAKHHGASGGKDSIPRNHVLQSRINCQPDGIAGAMSAKWAKGTGGPAGDEHYNLITQAVDCRNLVENEEISATLQSKQTGGHSLNYQKPIRRGYRVRRLTPTECERLQGFPDGWTEGFPDTTRYKALGNSVAVPCVEFVMEGIVREWVLS